MLLLFSTWYHRIFASFEVLEGWHCPQQVIGRLNRTYVICINGKWKTLFTIHNLYARFLCRMTLNDYQFQINNLVIDLLILPKKCWSYQRSHLSNTWFYMRDLLPLGAFRIPHLHKTKDKQLEQFISALGAWAFIQPFDF